MHTLDRAQSHQIGESLHLTALQGAASLVSTGHHIALATSLAWLTMASQHVVLQYRKLHDVDNQPGAYVQGKMSPCL